MDVVVPVSRTPRRARHRLSHLTADNNQDNFHFYHFYLQHQHHPRHCWVSALNSDISHHQRWFTVIVICIILIRIELYRAELLIPLPFTRFSAGWAAANIGGWKEEERYIGNVASSFVVSLLLLLISDINKLVLCIVFLKFLGPLTPNPPSPPPHHHLRNFSENSFLLVCVFVS